ncbi:PREDICTED: pregnancy zone protein-like [Cyprinodon variegatus]|uniref:pregnancy zone protein-like n=1 Tax=Cyprinodon variegatus TaxID=28743 RepID=UPI000742B066|nr:PREDICTED: pregnancy zone protein-like [Cyprinodon variegatus]
MAPVLLTALSAALFASALLIDTTAADLKDTSYAVTVSSRLTGGKQDTMCAIVQNPTEGLSLNITLTVDSIQNVILEKTISEDFTNCFKFQVPAVLSRTIAKVEITLQGKGASLSKKTEVVIEPPGFIHIVQTDKPIYKPGQVVKFRIVSLDDNFLPVNRVYTEVVLKDPNSNRIAQWLNQEINKGILDLSHPSIPEAAEGTYTITAVMADGEISHIFEIKEYVLPKFEVKVEMPSVITILDKTTTFKICGHKVQDGRNESGQMWSILSVCLQVKVVGADGQPVANELLYLFVENDKTLALTTNAKGMATFSLDTSRWTGSISIKVLSKDTKENEPFIPDLRRPDYGKAYLYLSPAYSKSNSFLNLKQISESFPCNSDATIKAQYIIQGTALKQGQTVVNVLYVVMSKGAVVRHGQVPVMVQPGTVNKGELSFSLSQVMKLAPVAQVSVYFVMANGEMVADSQDYPIQLCLNNKVSLKFSSLQQLPAEKTTLTLNANPKSLCSVRAIDQSILLLQPEQELTVDSVFSQLPVQQLWGYDYEVDDHDLYPCFPGPVPRPVPDLQAAVEPEAVERLGRKKRSFFFNPFYQKIDAYSAFKGIGVKIMTNFDVKKPQNCSLFKFNGMPEALPLQNEMQVLFRSQVGEATETIRKDFPETWIWDLVSVGDGGTASLQKTVPDTITKWAASAFCVSPSGFGVSPNTGLITFQPFFVSLTLPYSVIRGEVFTLKATVFNYLSQCIMVKATLAGSNQYTFRDCEGCKYTSCLCGDESKTFSWIVTPTALGAVNLTVSAEALRNLALCGNEVTTVPKAGRIDTVIQTLLVEAEGTPQMKSHNALLCPADGPVERKISLRLPARFVAGSARATVSVLGDLMGRALQNLDKLLAMPYGCGEQNMLLFAPNIFILNYLKSSGQLTDAILQKAKHFLESGYQRQLNYKRDDSSYSAFGNSDPSGNTWLTAFVMKSFGGASDYIYVDPQQIEDIRTWLYGLQNEDGCFMSVGKLFHNSMKGGVSDEVSLTAYIVAALLELNGGSTDPVVQKGLGCLKDAVVKGFDNLYTTALMSYTFSLAGDQEMRSKLISILDLEAKKEGGTIHWERVESSVNGMDSIAVEMTSYVLLALLTSPPLNGFGLDYASGIIRWLAQQQNPYGGFSSTQDTVVALQALAKYAAATYSPQGITKVTVTTVGGPRKEFTVSQSNRLLLQQEELSKIPGEYTVRAEGQSCVLTQISLHYNIPPPDDFSAFSITKKVDAYCDLKRPKLQLSVSVRYQGRRAETNMVVLNIKLLSGYVVEQSSLSSAKRVDIDNGFIDIYLDGLKRDEIQTFKVVLEEDQRVGNLKPAVIKVYDYYQPTDQAATDYTSPCA